MGLEDRKALLKPQHIDHVEGRLSALTFKINSISEQKTSVEAATKDDKLNKLASLVSGQSSMATAVCQRSWREWRPLQLSKMTPRLGLTLWILSSNNKGKLKMSSRTPRSR